MSATSIGIVGGPHFEMRLTAQGILSLACVVSMLPAATAQVSVEECLAADLSGVGDQTDGRISVHDMLEVLAQYHCESIDGGAQCSADISGSGNAPDGVVNVHDGERQTRIYSKHSDPKRSHQILTTHTLERKLRL